MRMLVVVGLLVAAVAAVELRAETPQHSGTAGASSAGRPEVAGVVNASGQIVQAGNACATSRPSAASSSVSPSSASSLLSTLGSSIGYR